MKYIDIQNEVIKKYRIDLCNGTKCRNDWSRTHAHVKIRRVCKWERRNSIQSTFTLFHEIGHIETTKSWMRRAESEYYATVWAIDQFKVYNLEVPETIIREYQEYIDEEIDRGQRRGGSGYGNLNLKDHKVETMTKLKEVRESKGLTQSKLAELSGINVRMIQHYEQGSKDINKAEAITVYKLSKALKCKVEQILNI